MNVAGSIVLFSAHIKLLGVTLDKYLSFRKHTNLVSQSCHYHIKALRYIRHTLDTHTASLIAHALISSRLDYANAVLYGSPEYNFTKLQHIQNTLARIVIQSNRPTHSEALLQQLHWLPVHTRVCFLITSISCFTYSSSPTDPITALKRPTVS